MIPYSVDKLILNMIEDMDTIKKDIVPWKFNFCNEFEKELDLEMGEYSQSVFDYVFNLFFFKQAFGKDGLKKKIDEIRDLNFYNSQQTCEFFSKQYLEFIILYKKHFMDYFGFSHDDPLHIQRKIDSSKGSIGQKLLEYF